MPRDKILVVDDSPTLLKLVELVLTRAGYDVSTASDGAAAIELARDAEAGGHLPDLVLLDYLMPGLDGLAVATELREDPALCAIPIVIMSAHGEELPTELRELPSFSDAVAKPFTPDALLTVVAHALQTRSHKRRASSPLPLDVVLETASDATTGPNDAPSPSPSVAALAGDMAQIAIADIYGLLQDQGQTGILGLTHGHARLRVFLNKGRVHLATAVGVAEEFLLGRFLVEAGAVTAAALAKAVEERKTATENSGLLGESLVQKGLTTPEAVSRALGLQTAALVFETLRWGAGKFYFETAVDLPAPATQAALGLGLDTLLIEGFRRVDEWRLIEREVGDFDMVFVRDEGRVALFGGDRLVREEHVVLELCNGRNNVREIIAASRMGSFDTTKMLYRLLRTKLVRRRLSPVAA
jgi:CheY-like chemotaxis protein/uncharacterized membrane protein (Fun14 family)